MAHANRRLVVTVVAASLLLALCLAMAWRAVRSHEIERLRQERQVELRAALQLKAAQISSWISERKGDGQQLRANGFVAERAGALAADPGNAELREGFVRWLDVLVAHAYRSALLVTAEGKILCGSGVDSDAMGPGGRDVVARAIEKGEVVFQDLHRGPRGDLHFDLAAPLLTRSGGRAPTALFLRIDAARIAEFVQVPPTTARTSEFLLVRREGEEVVYLHDLRFRSGTTLTLRRPLSEPGLLAAKAARGARGALEGLDYRGVSVQGVATELPELKWFLIAKIDRAEILEEADERLLYLAAIVLLLVFVASLVLATAWRMRIRQELTRRDALTGHYDYLTRYGNDIVVLATLEGRIVEANDRAFSAFGYTREEFIGSHISRHRAAGGPTLLESILKELGEKGQARYESLYRRKDDSVFPAEMSVRVFERGGVRYQQGIIRDISERKAFEEQLFHSRQMLQLVLDTIPQRVFWKDRELRYLGCNQPFAQDAGVAGPEAVKGRSDYELSWKVDAEAYRADDQKVIDSTQPKLGFEEPQTRPDGTRLWLRTNKVPLRGSGGEVIGVLGTYEDITRGKLAEDALADQKERLAVTVRCIGDGVIATDLEQRIVLINRVAEELTGWSAEEAEGQPVSSVLKLVDSRTREPVSSPVGQVLATGQIVELAKHPVLLSKGGRECLIADSGAPIRDRQSKVIGVVLVFRDVTAKEKLEDEVARAQKLESLAVLAGGIAHDFNNFLTGILGNIALAKLEVAERTELHQLLSDAELASQRAKDLTQQLLTFARGGAPVKSVGPLGPVIRDATRFACRGSSVACRVEVPEDLWSADADASQIGQVVNNIVLNAVQSMPAGGTVVVTGRNHRLADDNPFGLKPGAYLEVEIRDSGVGIPQSILGRIFDPYFTTKQKGSGLGLAVCYSIVTRHDGRIRVVSKPGEGSTFIVLLPAVEGSGAEVPATVKEALRGSGRVLVMDDDDSVRRMAQAALTRMGYHAECVPDGAAALTAWDQARAQGAPFDFVIMDLTVPGGMGGKEAVTRLLQRDAAARVIVSSGYSKDPIMSAYREAGFRAVLVKPYTPQELKAALDRAAQPG